MALRLVAMTAGDEVARRIQLILQYAPEPPFAGAGSPSTAAPAVVAELRAGHARSSR